MRPQRRAAVIALYSCFVVVAVVYAASVWVLQIPLPRKPLELLLVLLLTFGLPSLLLLFVAWDAEVSREGVRNIGPIRSGELFRWNDFRQQRVEEGFDIHAYKLNDLTDDPPRQGTFQFVGGELDEWLHELIRNVWVRPDLPSTSDVLYTNLTTLTQSVRIVLASTNGLTLIENDLSVNETCQELRQNAIDLANDQSVKELIEEAPANLWSKEFEKWRNEAFAEYQKHLAKFYELEKRWQGSLVPWSAVESVAVWQREHGRRDFDRLIVRIDDREMQWTTRRLDGAKSRNFSGADAADLLAMFRRHVPASRFVTSAAVGRPRSVEEWQRRYEVIVTAKQNTYRIQKSLIIAILFSMAIVSLVDWAGGLASSVSFGPMLLGMWYFEHRDLKKLECQYTD